MSDVLSGHNNPKADRDDLPGQAYASLKDAWQSYHIAIGDGQTQKAKEAACVINGIRAGNGLEPLEFENLNGFTCDPTIASPDTDRDPHPSNLSKLPKGSDCTDWKQVPARSSYWTAETKTVERCANWSTPGGDDDGGASDESGGEGGESDDDEDTDDDDPYPGVPDRVNGWLLRRGPGGDSDVIQYVAETSRLAPAKWSRTDDIYVGPEIVFSRGKGTIRIKQYNVSTGEKEQGPGGLTTTTYRDPEKAVERLNSWLHKHDPDRSLVLPEENGFVAVTSSRSKLDWQRSELPDSADYDAVQVHAEWRYTGEEAREQPEWDVYALFVDGDETVKRKEIRSDLRHVARAVKVANDWMQNFSVDVDPPETVGPWVLQTDSQRVTEWRADTGKDVPQHTGGAERLYKYVRVNLTANGYVARLQKGYEDDDPSGRETVTEIASTDTEVGAVQAAIDWMAENQDVDETEDGVDLPDTVNGWSRVDPDDVSDDVTFGGLGQPIYAWEADDPVYIYINERDSKTSNVPYQVKLTTDRGGSVSWSSHETMSDAIDQAIAKMQERAADPEECEFETEFGNDIGKPIGNLWFYLGAGSSGSGVSTRTHVEAVGDPGDRRVILQSATMTTATRVTIPADATESLTVDNGGLRTFNGGVLEDVYRDAKKSDSAGLRTGYNDNVDKPTIVANAGGRSSSARAGYPNARLSGWPQLDSANAILETTGRELETAIRAVGVILDSTTSDETVLLDVDDGEAVFVVENDAGERAKATIGEIEDDADITGNGRGGFKYKLLKDLTKAIPKPASTVVTLDVIEGTPDMVRAQYSDVDVSFEALIAGVDPVPDYDLSAPMWCHHVSKPSILGNDDDCPNA